MGGLHLTVLGTVRATNQPGVAPSCFLLPYQTWCLLAANQYQVGSPSCSSTRFPSLNMQWHHQPNLAHLRATSLSFKHNKPPSTLPVHPGLACLPLVRLDAGPDILPVLDFSLFLLYIAFRQLLIDCKRLQKWRYATPRIICNIKILVGFNWLGLIDPNCNLRFHARKAWNCNLVDLLKICKISLSEMRYNYHNISIRWLQPNTTTRN